MKCFYCHKPAPEESVMVDTWLPSCWMLNEHGKEQEYGPVCPTCAEHLDVQPDETGDYVEGTLRAKNTNEKRINTLAYYPNLLHADLADMEIWRDCVQRLPARYGTDYCTHYQAAFRKVLRNLGLL